MFKLNSNEQEPEEIEFIDDLSEEDEEILDEIWEQIANEEV